HIVDSYTLAGQDLEVFEPQLAKLTQHYAYQAIELALVEVLVSNWVRYPLPRGMAFLAQVEACLQSWQTADQVATTLTATQFEQVTGLPWGGWEPAVPLTAPVAALGGDAGGRRG
ncbi:MAG TPA: hypothetical protein V6D02_08025, partial [Candidatus Obscuribacterales bacterium]